MVWDGVTISVFLSCRFYTGGELYIEFESIRW